PSSSSPLLDLSFGQNGRAAYAPDTTAGRRLAVDSLGRIVVGGTDIDSLGNRRLSVWRFSGSGVLDTSFGSGGIFSYSAAYASGGFDVAVDSSSRVLASGWVADASRRTDLALLRLTSSGTLDTSFGTGGITTIDDGEDEIGAAVALDSTARV